MKFGEGRARNAMTGLWRGAWRVVTELGVATPLVQ